MVMKLVQVIGDLPEPYLVGAILLPVLFVGWVITNEGRTRHLTQLIRAVRGPDDSSGGEGGTGRRKGR